jgi:transitional endoplasmic reticulum ATPase
MEQGSLSAQRIAAVKAWEYEAPQVKNDGDKIVLPALPTNMSVGDAATLLRKLADQENLKVNVQERINCIPNDGIVAFNRALNHLFGMVVAAATPTFFGPRPPQTVSIPTGPGSEDAMQCIIGSFSIPPMPEDHLIELIVDTNCIHVVSKTIRKYEAIVRMIVKKTVEYLRTSSIYKGRALRIHDESTIEFIKLGNITPDSIILNDHIKQLVNTTIFTPIRSTERCRQVGIPLKRGVLLEGPYGTGKSLISAAAARLCVENGWTFLMTDQASNLAVLLEMAKRLSPAVVFVEDIDRAVTVARDESANTILNTLDGVLSKDSEIMVVLTTNHVDRIGRAMLRPGRLDAVISMEVPDHNSIKALLHLYGNGNLVEDFDYDAAAQPLANMIPATIREVIERSKLHTLSRTTNSFDKITTQDLITTAKGMKRHMELLADPAEKKKSTVEEALNVLGASLFEDMDQAKLLSLTDRVLVRLGGIKNTIALTAEQTNEIDGRTKKILEAI